MMEEKIYQNMLAILRSELLPAMGCTEPIAVAYAAAVAKETLGEIPNKVEISVSGNILKNVKSVVVPNTGGLRGVNAAAATGIIAGDASKKLEVISEVSQEAIEQVKEFLNRAEFVVSQSRSDCIFDIVISLHSVDNCASVRIAGHHTNIVRISKNGEDLLKHDFVEEETSENYDYGALNVRDILDFANNVRLDDIADIIERQIEYNTAISKEGLTNDYGARVGKVLLHSFGDSLQNRAKAVAAAGSDARMNGCSLPVVIVSGSGNQGMTASLPVIEYAKALGSSHEQLLRALVLSNLITIRLKSGIGRLSAYCGAVSAGCGAGAAVCYLLGGGYDEIAHTVINALAINSGIICDGAKSSCAAKIASAVEGGLIGMEMYRNGSMFLAGDGILDIGVEETIDNVGEIARVGMRETDEQIIRLMIKDYKDKD